MAITLDSLRESLEKNYADTDVVVGDTTVQLHNPSRLSKENRKALSEALKAFKTDEEDRDDIDVEALVAGPLTAACSDWKALEAAVKENFEERDHLLVFRSILEGWLEDQKVGEASASQS